MSHFLASKVPPNTTGVIGVIPGFAGEKYAAALLDQQKSIQSPCLWELPRGSFLYVGAFDLG